MQWPPNEQAEPMLLKQAAARLGLSVSGLQDRLKSALARALALGLDRPVALTDPTYLHVLARAGYIHPPVTFDHRSSPGTERRDLDTSSAVRVRVRGGSSTRRLEDGRAGGSTSMRAGLSTPRRP
jgi:hypothetical protein